MSGLFSGVSNFLYGPAPDMGFDPSMYLSMMQNMDSQIGQLYDSAPKSDVIDSPAFARISAMLGPSADGSLSPGLLAMYNSGALQNNLNASRDGALALSGIQGRGLAGSSIQNQALENVGMQNTLANSSLLASLYGLQNQNTSQLAGFLGQGSEFDVSQNNALLNAHAAALAGIAGGYGNLASQGFGANLSSQMAQYQNQGNLTNSLLSAGLMYGAMGGFGGAGAGPIATPGAMPYAGADAGMGFGSGAGAGMMVA